MKNTLKRALPFLTTRSSIEGLFAVVALAAIFYGLYRIYEPAAFAVCGLLVWFDITKGG